MFGNTIRQLFAAAKPAQLSERERERTLFLVSADASVCNTVRVFALKNGWRLLIAPNVANALRSRDAYRTTISLLDDSAVESAWQAEIRKLIERQKPEFPILLCSQQHEIQRFELLALGGFEVVQKPLSQAALLDLSKSCCRLADDLDNAA